MPVGNRNYDDSILLQKALNYPDTPFESLAPMMALATAYFSGQHDGTHLFTTAWPIDFTNVTAYWQHLNPYFRQTSLTLLTRGRFDLEDEWGSIGYAFIHGAAQGAGQLNLRIQLEDGANIDTLDEVKYFGQTSRRNPIATTPDYNNALNSILMHTGEIEIDTVTSGLSRSLLFAGYETNQQDTTLARSLRPIWASFFLLRD